jgi:23S rRNA pseudouridine1911/1915/1917 synthase
MKPLALETALSGSFPRGMASKEILNEEGELISLEISPAFHGLRLDQAMTAHLDKLSRSYIQKLIAENAVTISGAVVTKAAQRVKAGDSIEIWMTPSVQDAAFQPEAMDLDIRYEDEHVLVLCKPAGLVVHPAPGNWSGTLMNGLMFARPDLMLLPRAGIVHRLDKDTSGLMVVAKTRQAMDGLVQQLAARSVKRRYWALTPRRWDLARSLVVDKPIGRDSRQRQRMAVVSADSSGAKEAITDILLLEASHAGALIECRLRTGRTHQIRVHMASLRHPLLGDDVYGGERAVGMRRQALHAFALAFDHPMQFGVSVSIFAGAPADFAHAVKDLGLDYNVVLGSEATFSSL